MCLKNKRLQYQITKLNKVIYNNRTIELIEILGNTKKFLARNFFAGVLKGVGAGIGFYIITAIIIYYVQKIIKLNIPIISQHIADIVEIVEKTK